MAQEEQSGWDAVPVVRGVRQRMRSAEQQGQAIDAADQQSELVGQKIEQQRVQMENAAADRERDAATRLRANRTNSLGKFIFQTRGETEPTPAGRRALADMAAFYPDERITDYAYRSDPAYTGTADPETGVENKAPALVFLREDGTVASKEISRRPALPGSTGSTMINTVPLIISDGERKRISNAMTPAMELAAIGQHGSIDRRTGKRYESKRPISTAQGTQLRTPDGVAVGPQTPNLPEFGSTRGGDIYQKQGVGAKASSATEKSTKSGFAGQKPSVQNAQRRIRNDTLKTLAGGRYNSKLEQWTMPPGNVKKLREAYLVAAHLHEVTGRYQSPTVAAATAYKMVEAAFAAGATDVMAYGRKAGWFGKSGGKTRPSRGRRGNTPPASDRDLADSLKRKRN